MGKDTGRWTHRNPPPPSANTRRRRLRQQRQRSRRALSQRRDSSHPHVPNTSLAHRTPRTRWLRRGRSALTQTLSFPSAGPTGATRQLWDHQLRLRLPSQSPCHDTSNPDASQAHEQKHHPRLTCIRTAVTMKRNVVQVGTLTWNQHFHSDNHCVSLFSVVTNSIAKTAFINVK